MEQRFVFIPHEKARCRSGKQSWPYNLHPCHDGELCPAGERATKLLVYGKVLDSEKDFKVGDVAIPPSQDLTLLGFTIDEKLSPQPYLQELHNAVL